MCSSAQFVYSITNWERVGSMFSMSVYNRDRESHINTNVVCLCLVECTHFILEIRTSTLAHNKFEARSGVGSTFC